MEFKVILVFGFKVLFDLKIGITWVLYGFVRYTLEGEF